MQSLRSLRSFALRAALFSAVAAPLAGCAANMPPREASGPVAVAEAPAPAVLDRSYYSKDASGSLGESELQHVLSTPIDLAFPARVGVVPLSRAFSSDGEVGVDPRSTASVHLADKLRGFTPFSHVSDVSTELPNVGGLEGLRAIAARYRLRYLVLVSQRFEDDTHVNAWAALYPTIIGIFVTPSVTVSSRGILQADLFDVRTGTVLASVVEPMSVDSQTFAVGSERTHREEQSRAARVAAERLAARLKVQTNELLAHAERAASAEEQTARILPAPVRDGLTRLPFPAPPPGG
jgi:rhombotail lipoprotein